MIKTEELFNLGGVYGDESIGDPVEYDNLKLVLTDTTVEITVFTSEDEQVLRILRTSSRLWELRTS